MAKAGARGAGRSEEAAALIVVFRRHHCWRKDFSTWVARLKKENIDFVHYGGYHPQSGRFRASPVRRRAETQLAGPEGVANVSLSNIAGESAEGFTGQQTEESTTVSREQTDCGCHQSQETRS